MRDPSRRLFQKPLQCVFQGNGAQRKYNKFFSPIQTNKTKISWYIRRIYQQQLQLYNCVMNIISYIKLHNMNLSARSAPNTFHATAVIKLVMSLRMRMNRKNYMQCRVSPETVLLLLSITIAYHCAFYN